MIKSKTKSIKYFILTLLFLIPLIKFFLDVQFGITLMDTVKVIGTYIAVYSILTVLAIIMVRKISFCAVMIIFWYIYVFSLFLSNGLDDRFHTIKKYNSPNNENILIVDTQADWYPGATVRLYKEVGPFLRKLIRTPKLDGTFENYTNVSLDISWEDDNTVMINGGIIKMNMKKLKKVKEKLPDQCDYEIIDEQLYLNIK